MTKEQVLEAARELLLEVEAVTSGWAGDGAVLVEGKLELTFRWRRLPYRFAVRLPLDDLSESPWTGLPVTTAEEWVREASGLLMEELDTGAAAWLPRYERDGLVELLLDEPRVGELAPDMGAVYYVSELTQESNWFVREQRLDPQPALDAARRGQLLNWWCAYVNNSRGLPLVAQLVVIAGRGEAQLAYLEVREDLPLPVPAAVIAEMAYMAVWEAACHGATLIVTTAQHPGLALLGLQRDGELSFWQAEGPTLAPPNITKPARPRTGD